MPADETDAANDEFVQQVYEKLHAIARRQLRAERPNHTLQATALVNEAFMKMNSDRQLSWDERDAFFAAAAMAMRRILLDHSRKKKSQRRGGGVDAIPIDIVDLAMNADSEWITSIDEALKKLAAEEPRAARVVELRFYCGLSVEETAEHLGASPRTVAREWNFARARLYQLLDVN